MKIAICTLGSRGDIQPFLVLLQFLNQNVHQVKISSAEMYETLASNQRLVISDSLVGLNSILSHIQRYL